MRTEADLLIERANKELEKITGATLTLDVETLLAIIGFLQLGLRHPSAQTTATAALVRAFVNQLIEDLAPAGGYLRELLMKGFDPDFDVMR